MGCCGSKHGRSGYSDLSKEKDASKPLNVIILGRHQVGKSTVGNAILGRRVFTFWSFFHKGCVEKQRNVNGRFINVVHAPGWTGFNHTTSKYNKGEIKYSIIREGRAACVLVISIDSEFTVQDMKAVEQHMGVIECGNDSVWSHTVLVFIKHGSDNLSKKEIEGRPDLVCLLKKCDKWFMFNKDNVTDLLRSLDDVATQDNGIQPKNSACSQNSQMYSQCPKERAEKENGGLQQATTSIRRGTIQESHPELTSASENTSGELREVFKIHVPPGPDSQQGQSDVNGNMATLEKVYNKSMATVTSQKKDLAQLCRYLTSDEPGSEFVELLKQKDHKLYQRLGALFVDENRKKIIDKVSTPIPIADSLLDKYMINQQLYDEIRKEEINSNSKSMRLIYTALNTEKKKAFFLQLLVQNDRFLVQELAEKNLQELEASDVHVP